MKNINAKDVIVNGIRVTARVAEFGFAAIGAMTLGLIVGSLRNEGGFTLSITHKKDEE